MAAGRDDLVFHMARVQVAERDLRDLGVVWQMIESSAAISCPDAVASILPTLAHTRERFDTLRGELVASMAEGQRAELGDELSAKAQCAIDILVRNLYERTADVGFLATDDIVRAFVGADDATRAAQLPAMRHRLEEYRAKYTVYDDIALLDPRGRLLVRLDDAAPLAESRDAIVADALAADAWVERFGASDLSSDAAPSLRYGHRIGDDGGRSIGVLVLRFRFVDEMQRIFADMADDRRQVALMLIDDRQRVIATNDEAHVPTGTRLMPVADRSVELTFFGGREYLAVRCPSQGYQGYAGPGWRAQAMVSLLTAFRHRDDGPGDDTEVSLDQAELKKIRHDADVIHRELRHVVWNGRLMAGVRADDRRRLQAVLSQVNAAGGRTRSRVERAVQDLYCTSLSRARNQARELAALAAGIMDRNLYERANNCRWWALSPAIQRLLAAPGAQATSRLNALLDHVNSLYAVYSRLVLFDASGVVQAASRLAEEDGIVGAAVEPEWLERTRQLSDSQRYAVADFGPTALHADGDTYVYLAAVRAAADARFLGGIGIVFHSARELQGMLTAVLGERVGYAGFVQRGTEVLAATDPDALAAAARELATLGTRDSGRHEATALIGGVHYACVRVRATGYREFKLADGYDNDVHAVVGLRLGAAERRQRHLADTTLTVPPPRADSARASWPCSTSPRRSTHCPSRR